MKIEYISMSCTSPYESRNCFTSSLTKSLSVSNISGPKELGFSAHILNLMTEHTFIGDHLF